MWTMEVGSVPNNPTRANLSNLRRCSRCYQQERFGTQAEAIKRMMKTHRVLRQLRTVTPQDSGAIVQASAYLRRHGLNYSDTAVHRALDELRVEEEQEQQER